MYNHPSHIRSKAKAIAIKRDKSFFVHSFLLGLAIICSAVIVHFVH